MKINKNNILFFIVGLGVGALAIFSWNIVSSSSSVSNKYNGKEVGTIMDDAPGVTEKVEYENDRVRIVRFHFEPHAKVPMHPAPDLVSTWLTDGHFKLTHPDGTVQDLKVRAGQTEWFDAQMHTGENLGDTPLDFVVVQMKS